MNEETSQSSYRVASDELRAFIERFERLDAEKKDIADQQKPPYKGNDRTEKDDKILKETFECWFAHTLTRLI